MLPGWQGIALACAMQGRWPDPWLLGLFFLGATLMRTAGCAYNDIVDRDIDAKVARTAGRPIAAGQISVRAAWGFVVACSLASALILLLLNPWAEILAVASLVLAAAYPFMKRITWWPQAWLGLTFNWGALVGYAAANGGWPLAVFLFRPGLVFNPNVRMPLSEYLMGDGLALPALLLYASGVFWTLGYDTIYAVQDIEDDALAGVKSSARRLGAAAPVAVTGFYVVSLVLAAAAAWQAHLGPAFWPFGAMYALALLIQPHRLRLNEPARALALFQLNPRAGLLLFLALAAGVWLT